MDRKHIFLLSALMVAQGAQASKSKSNVEFYKESQRRLLEAARNIPEEAPLRQDGIAVEKGERARLAAARGNLSTTSYDRISKDPQLKREAIAQLQTLAAMAYASIGTVQQPEAARQVQSAGSALSKSSDKDFKSMGQVLGTLGGAVKSGNTSQAKAAATAINSNYAGGSRSGSTSSTSQSNPLLDQLGGVVMGLGMSLISMVGQKFLGDAFKEVGAGDSTAATIGTLGGSLLGNSAGSAMDPKGASKYDQTMQWSTVQAAKESSSSFQGTAKTWIESKPISVKGGGSELKVSGEQTGKTLSTGN